MGQTRDAVIDLVKAVQLDRNFAEHFSDQYSRKAGETDIEMAITDLTEALRLFPNVGEIYLIRAYAYQQIDSHTEANSDFAMFDRFKGANRLP